MGYLRGLTKVCSGILVHASLVYCMVGCAAGAEDPSAAAQTTEALSVEEAPPAPPDEIVGPFTKDLDGLSLVYNYTHGGDYFITYGADTVTFRLPLPDGSHTPPITVPYFARKLRANMYMVHWVNPEKTVHVTQVLDLPQREVNVAALMPGQWQLFDVGQITEMKRPKKH